MIIISLRFSGGSTDEAHDIAHIASSIVARVSGLFCFPRALLRCAFRPVCNRILKEYPALASIPSLTAPWLNGYSNWFL